ncbi:hypothetical protein LJR175_000992 [Variovorax sp. LjRoot175]|uniref:hypothetical protein n=1 Tax=Variovorax sp. LjRoot175 TaxID=3342276 RepID=UPI003ED10761
MPPPIPLTIKLAPEPKPEPPLYEHPTVVGASLALVGVVVTVAITSKLRSRDLQHAAVLAKEERDHSRELAKTERDHSREQAGIEREHAAEQANVDRQHSSDEAQRARLMQARKVLYSELIDQYLKVMGMFATLPDIDIRKTEYAEVLRLFGAAVHKTWLLSEVETAFHARELHSKVNELFFRLLARLPELHKAKRRIERAEGRRERAAAERDRLKATQEHAEIRGAGPKVVSGIRDEKVRSEQIVLEAMLEVAAARAQHDSLAQEFRRYLLPEANGLLMDAQEFMYRAREELGLEGDSSVLRDQTADILRRVVQATADLEDAIRSAAETKKAPSDEE